MRRCLFLAVAIFSLQLQAHFECTGVCKYYIGDSLQSAVVSGTGNSYASAVSSMKSSCSSYCNPSYATGCETINYSCSTPDHHGAFLENLGISGDAVEGENYQ